MRSFVWRKLISVPLLVVAITGACSECGAQAISLNDKQRARLIALVSSDPEAKALCGRVIEDANQDLSAQPHPLKQIQTEGKLQSDPVKVETQKGLMDTGKVFSLGIAYTVTGDLKYSEKVKQFILAWAEVNKPTGDPIDETNLEPLMIGYDLVRKTFSDSERDRADRWLKKVAEEEISNKRSGGTAINNWNSHRLKIIGLAAFLTGDEKLLHHAVDGYMEQIRVNLRPDGSSLDFEERDALHYHCYDLEPLLTLARVAQLNGIDLYNYTSPKGASLPKSVQFALPYASGEKTHAEFVNSTVAFDRKRAAAGEQRYIAGRPFDPSDARKTVELDSFFDASMQPLLLKMYGGRAHKYATFQEVFLDAERQ
ncbi:MAG TPA: alginate lyase family protein [Blastocatellia bacterium]